MGNLAYLCCSGLERTYPSFRNRRYRPELHTLACARARIPLLWLALFRPEDLRRDELLDASGEDLGELAPLVRRVDGLARLDDGVARLARALPGLGPLGAHAASLRALVAGARGAWLTIELEEVAALERSRRAFDQRLARALAWVGGARVAAPARDLAALSGVDPAVALVSPGELAARARPRKADVLARVSVLGASHIRAVPWEAAAPPDGAARRTDRGAARRAPKPRLGEALLAALSAGDVAAARAALAAGADPNARGFAASSAMDAVRWGRVPPGFAAELVAAGFDLHRRRQGYDALQAAIWADARPHAEDLLALGASPTALDGFGRAPLVLAAYAGATACLELLLERGEGVDDRLVGRAIAKAEARLAAGEGFPLDRPAEAQRVRAAVARLRRELAARGRDA